MLAGELETLLPGLEATRGGGEEATTGGGDFAAGGGEELLSSITADCPLSIFVVLL